MAVPPRPPLLLLALLTAAAPTAAQLRVTATAPPRLAPLPSVSAPIRVTFSTAVQPSTLTAHNVALLGRWSGPVPVAATLESAGTVLVVQPLRPLFVGENVTLTLADGIAATAGGTLSGGAELQFRAPSARGPGAFIAVRTIPLRRPGEGPIATYGVHAGDVDGDGSPDITAMNELGHDLRVLRNDGCGGFGPMTLLADPNQWPSPSASADFDRDGRIDLVTGNQNGASVTVRRNPGTGLWGPPQVHSANGWVHGVAVLDANGDGWPDVAAPNTVDAVIWLNQQNGTLQHTGNYPSGGVHADNLEAIDLDEDGHLDLAIGNVQSGDVTVLLGNGDGSFRPHATFPAVGNPFHADAGDLDGDGHGDVAFCCRGTNTFTVLFGDGRGNLSAPVSFGVGFGPAGIDLADLDGDGDLDAVISNFGSASWTIWWNAGNRVFVNPTTLPAPRAASCATLADFDRDGLLDILGTDERDDVLVLYRQDTASPPGVQPPRCASTLRIDQQALCAGFGARPPLVASGARPLSLGLSGEPGAVAFLALGLPLAPGLPFGPPGLVNLDLSSGVFWLLDGLRPWAPRTDGRGEARWLLPPLSLPPGFTVTLQGALLGSSGLFLSNPETVTWL